MNLRDLARESHGSYRYSGSGYVTLRVPRAIQWHIGAALDDQARRLLAEDGGRYAPSLCERLIGRKRRLRGHQLRALAALLMQSRVVGRRPRP